MNIHDSLIVSHPCLKIYNISSLFQRGEAQLFVLPRFLFQEEEEESDGLSADLNDILKSAVQTQSVLSPVENSESDVEDGQEKLTRDLRLSSTRAASMYV